MVTDAASKAQRRCDDNGAGDEDAHVNSPVLVVASGDDYIDSSGESCDTFDTQRLKNEGSAYPISRRAGAWYRWGDSNHRPLDPQSSALTN